jgi:hypothetical protein
MGIYIFLKQANWQIPSTFLSNNSNHRIRTRKQGPQGVFMEKKDVAMVAWTFDMQ